MQIIYEGKDIAAAVDVQKADITDNAGGMPDSVELVFNDTAGLWSKWKPQKNHRVAVKEKGFSSGLMFIDELEQERGLFTVRALSIPQEAKTENTKAWENVRFMEFAGEMARKYGLELQAFGVQNHLYPRVDQFEQPDLAFLSYRCMMEGYALKITDGTAVIYDERHIESQASARKIYADQVDGTVRFKDKSTGIFNSCRVTYGSMGYEFKPAQAPPGPVLKICDAYLSSPAEAERYSRGLLRQKNKHEKSGALTIRLDTGIAAGNIVEVHRVGMFDGRYFVEQAVHRLKEGRTSLKLRKPLEGY